MLRPAQAFHSTVLHVLLCTRVSTCHGVLLGKTMPCCRPCGGPYLRGAEPRLTIVPWHEPGGLPSRSSHDCVPGAWSSPWLTNFCGERWGRALLSLVGRDRSPGSFCGATLDVSSEHAGHGQRKDWASL